MKKSSHVIVSGAIHYFRIHPGEWSDRLDKAVAFGLNTVETYVPWNLHEPRRGEFNFSGIADLERFMAEVGKHDLKLILRPGPYICAEWENGGLPAWLTGRPGIRLRCDDPAYLAEVGHWFTELLSRCTPYQADRGGPIIMMQLENEYGSYGNDHHYLARLRDLMLQCGVSVPLFTSDGPVDHMLAGGTLPNVRQTVNFGSAPDNAFAMAKKYRPDETPFCMEFWDGWFDHWGDRGHHTRSAQDVADNFARILDGGGNVNFYMFSGGTNFGFTAGANGNFRTDYAPTVTSYDYDALLSEAGDPTPKFMACQKVLRDRFPQMPRVDAEQPAPTRKMVPASVRLTRSARLFDNLATLGDRHGAATVPPTMDELGATFGFIHYRTRLAGPLPSGVKLRLFEVNDYAQVWLNGQYLGHRFRDLGEHPFELPAVGPEGAVLELLVENTGRLNYGPWAGRDFKGIVNGVMLELQRQYQWEYTTLALARPEHAAFQNFDDTPGSVMLHRADFELQETASTYLIRPGGKGAVWINGFPLGRYWERGPQQALYVPGSALSPGRNTLIVLEQEKLCGSTLEFSAAPGLGPDIGV